MKTPAETYTPVQKWVDSAITQKPQAAPAGSWWTSGLPWDDWSKLADAQKLRLSNSRFGGTVPVVVGES